MTSLNMNITLNTESSVDLHMHTTYSDGRWPAQRLIDYLAAEKFDLVAVTDHDRVDKISEIQSLGAQQGLAVLSGAEMSTQWNGLMGDLLCYGFDPEQNEMAAITEDFVRQRLENAHEIYENLLQKGYKFPRLEEVLADRGGKLTNPYENRLLLQGHGYASNWSDAMKIVVEAGFRDIRMDMAQMVDAVHRSGGVGLIAHPGRREAGFTFYHTELLDKLRQDVPIDGIEVYHPSHTPELTLAYAEYARQNDLLVSTGSDSHCKPERLPKKHRAELSRRLLERVGVTVQ